MTALEEARLHRDYMVRMRRWFHQNPELSHKEFKTRDTIISELNRMGIPCEAVCETGVIGTVKGTGNGLCIALRADIDALPVQEESGNEYCSLNGGVMHACGHDGHTAALLGAAEILSKSPPANDVLLLFQPAEETLDGGKDMAMLPALKNADAIAGVHIWSTLPVGTINVEPGTRMARADIFEVEITGSTCHGSMPHMGVDAVYIASLIVTVAQAVVARIVNPLETAVLTFGSVHAGTAGNIMAGHAALNGTLRSMNDATGDCLIERLRLIVEHMAAAFGAKAVLRITQSTPPLINDPHSTRIAAECARQVVGAENLVYMPPTTGGEDFAYYLKNISGVFAFVGGGNPETGCSFPHHNNRFDFDEDALVYSAAFLAGFARQSKPV